MNKNKYFFAFFAFPSFFLPACNNSLDDSALVFYPRQVKIVLLEPGNMRIQEQGNWTGIDYYDIIDTNTTGLNIVKTRNFFLSLITSNDSLCHHVFFCSLIDGGNILDMHIESLEQEIRKNYRKGSSSSSSLDQSSKGDNIIFCEYRTTEITNVKISALQTIWGKAAGESLNNYFTIAEYKPPVIAAANTNKLLYGYSSSSYPKTLAEWLSLEPYAQANMYLVPTQDIDNLPRELNFVVEMTTKEGKVLQDTTRTIIVQAGKDVERY